MRSGAERIALTLWVGGMWVIGYIVAPTLFTVLDDNRTLAGEIAGRLFTIMSYLGLACGVIILVALLVRNGVRWRDGRVITVLLMLLVTLVGQFVLQPMMAELKAAGIAEGSEAATQFALLHGISSSLFLFNSLLGLGLVVFSSSGGLSEN